MGMERGRQGNYAGKEREKRLVSRCEIKQFRDWDRELRGLKAGETDERVIYVILVMISIPTSA